MGTCDPLTLMLHYSIAVSVWRPNLIWQTHRLLDEPFLTLTRAEDRTYTYRPAAGRQLPDTLMAERQAARQRVSVPSG